MATAETNAVVGDDRETMPALRPRPLVISSYSTCARVSTWA
jgi:hypothetical protein